MIPITRQNLHNRGFKPFVWNNGAIIEYWLPLKNEDDFHHRLGVWFGQYKTELFNVYLTLGSYQAEFKHAQYIEDLEILYRLQSGKEFPVSYMRPANKLKLVPPDKGFWAILTDSGVVVVPAIAVQSYAEAIVTMGNASQEDPATIKPASARLKRILSRDSVSTYRIPLEDGAEEYIINAVVEALFGDLDFSGGPIDYLIMVQDD